MGPGEQDLLRPLVSFDIAESHANRIAVKLVMVALFRQMLDAGYWMLAIQECTDGEIQNYQVSRNQYPGSARTGKGFRRNAMVKV